MSQSKTSKVIESILEVIVEELIASAREGHALGGDKGGRNVDFRGFGSFKVKLRKPRKAKDPRTAKEVSVPAKWITVFKVSKEFADAIAKLEQA